MVGTHEDTGQGWDMGDKRTCEVFCFGFACLFFVFATVLPHIEEGWEIGCLLLKPNERVHGVSHTSLKYGP